MRRFPLLLVIAAIGVAGCAKSSHDSSAASSSTTTSTAPLTSATRAALDRKACAAYEAFWDTDYSGGEPGPAMVARERALIDAVEAAPDQPLHDAVRGVIDGELGLPKFELRDTAADYQRKLAALPPDTRAALAAVEQNDRAVQSKCDAVGRPING